MGSVKGESRWSEDTLREAWDQMFDYSLYQNHFENLDVQCILMLLEGGLSHVKKVLTAYSALKASEKELVSQLEIKTHEYWTLKKEVDRPCSKCRTLEVSLLDARKRAKEAQDRMDSIANILKLGENMDPSQGSKRNVAMDLVSQMILGGSSPPPKRKKPSQERETPEKFEILAPDTCDVLTEKPKEGNCGVVPSSVQVSSPKLSGKPSPPLATSSFGTIKGRSSVARSPVLDVNIIPSRPRGTPLSKSFDTPSSSKPVDKVANVKKNLSVDMDPSINGKSTKGTEISPEKPIMFDLKAGPPPLDDTLKDYVKDSTGKLLANIWFDDDDDEDFQLSNKIAEKEEKSPAKEASPAVIPETPCPKPKKADFWLLKEKPGRSEISKASGRKLRQTRLELATKKKETKIDLSKVAPSTVNGPQANAVIAVEDEEEEIIALSPDAQKHRVGVEKYLSDSQDMDVNTTEFKPIASSTQKPTQAVNVERTRAEETLKPKPSVSDFDRLPTKASNKDCGFVYARDAVKKKSERQKLEGWECKECAKYYAAVGKNMDPAELKERMNACSRHRDKFKPKLNETPPGFWNPLFPSTEEVKGHESVRVKRN